MDSGSLHFTAELVKPRSPSSRGTAVRDLRTVIWLNGAFWGEKKKGNILIYLFQWIENEISNTNPVLIMISVHDLIQKLSFNSFFEDLGWWQSSFSNKTHFSLDKLTLIRLLHSLWEFKNIFLTVVKVDKPSYENIYLKFPIQI